MSISKVKLPTPSVKEDGFKIFIYTCNREMTYENV